MLPGLVSTEASLLGLQKVLFSWNPHTIVSGPCLCLRWLFPDTHNSHTKTAQLCGVHNIVPFSILRVVSPSSSSSNCRTFLLSSHFPSPGNHSSVSSSYVFACSVHSIETESTRHVVFCDWLVPPFLFSKLLPSFCHFLCFYFYFL